MKGSVWLSGHRTVQEELSMVSQMTKGLDKALRWAKIWNKSV